MELYITMEKGVEGKAWAYYSHFMVGDESSKYKLTVSGYSSYSTAGDSLSYHSGQKFTTKD